MFREFKLERIRNPLKDQVNIKKDLKTIKNLLIEVRSFRLELGNELHVDSVWNTLAQLQSLELVLDTLVKQGVGDNYIEYHSFPRIDLRRYTSDELWQVFDWAIEVEKLIPTKPVFLQGAINEAESRAKPKPQPIEKKSEEPVVNTPSLPSLVPFSVLNQKKTEEKAAKTLEERQKDAEAKVVEELSELKRELKAEYLKPKPKKIIHLPSKKQRLKINFQTLFNKSRENNKPKIKFDKLSKAVVDCKANKDNTRFQNQIDVLLGQYDTLQKSNKNNRCEIDIKFLVTFFAKFNDLYSDLLTADQNVRLTRMAVPTTRARSNSLPGQPPH